MPVTLALPCNADKAKQYIN